MIECVILSLLVIILVVQATLLINTDASMKALKSYMNFQLHCYWDYRFHEDVPMTTDTSSLRARLLAQRAGSRGGRGGRRGRRVTSTPHLFAIFSLRARPPSRLGKRV
jgi:hypothetical protein